jgi:FkbM family methyltransferase
MDAVNALCMGRGSDATVDKFEWRDVFFANTSNVKKGVCKQEHGEQFPLQTTGEAQPAFVHCLEAMPDTAKHLRQTAAHFAWKDHFVVENAAFSSTDGATKFQTSQIGTETTGICGKRSRDDNCQEVPLLRLDTYLRNQNSTDPHALIDLLSSDVEGYDAEVLLGAPETLKRVRVGLTGKVYGKPIHYKMLHKQCASKALSVIGLVWAAMFGATLTAGWLITDSITCPMLHVCTRNVILSSPSEWKNYFWRHLDKDHQFPMLSELTK